MTTSHHRASRVARVTYADAIDYQIENGVEIEDTGVADILAKIYGLTYIEVSADLRDRRAKDTT